MNPIEKFRHDIGMASINYYKKIDTQENNPMTLPDASAKAVCELGEAIGIILSVYEEEAVIHSLNVLKEFMIEISREVREERK